MAFGTVEFYFPHSLLKEGEHKNYFFACVTWHNTSDDMVYNGLNLLLVLNKNSSFPGGPSRFLPFKGFLLIALWPPWQIPHEKKGTLFVQTLLINSFETYGNDKFSKKHGANLLNILLKETHVSWANTCYPKISEMYLVWHFDNGQISNLNLFKILYIVINMKESVDTKHIWFSEGLNTILFLWYSCHN